MYTQLISIFLFLTLQLKVNSAPASTYLLVTRMGQCLDTKKDPIVISEMAIQTETKYMLTFTGWVNVSEDLENGWHVTVSIQKCQDIRNLDTCDFYKSISLLEDGCMESTDERLDKLYKYITPKLECPVRAGKYTVTDLPFHMEVTGLTAAASRISTSVFGYTYRWEGYLEEIRMFCVEAHLRMVYHRKHDWGSREGAPPSPSPGLPTPPSALQTDKQREEETDDTETYVNSNIDDK